ncbi:MAG TPA: hypothetical protein VE871_17560 [Longimicrobium sp.]|nr:hypothetical protein [Longimicrobium sp.]
MATPFERTRIRTRIRLTWKGGLRRSKERNTMTAYIAAHPGYLDDVFRIDAEMLAAGFVPMPMNRVKQPFDYQPRRTTQSNHECSEIF